MSQVFVSHSKADKDFCAKFDAACAHVGIRRFRSEFEDIEKPAWKTINREIRNSKALFLLVGKELVSRQRVCEAGKPSSNDWYFTQNWISYEVGVAAQKGIDVWVMCDDISINFPVPYFNNYDGWGIHMENPAYRRFITTVLTRYSIGKRIRLNKRFSISCPNSNCGATFNVWATLNKGTKIICPTCLREITFTDGWLLIPVQKTLKEKFISSMFTNV